MGTVNTLLNLGQIERSFAYERARAEIEGACMPPLLAGVREEGWCNLQSAECPLTDEVAYLDARRLLERHYADPQWVRVREEDEPLPAVTVVM